VNRVNPLIARAINVETTRIPSENADYSGVSEKILSPKNLKGDVL
jgi:hypothetical protein